MMLFNGRVLHVQDDSEMDGEDDDGRDSPPRPGTAGGGAKRTSTVDWEIMEGLKEGQKFEGQRPPKHEGFIMKRRKWPMKGWHKVASLVFCLLCVKIRSYEFSVCD